MKVTIVGLGLIGGSIGLDLKRGGLTSERIGVDANESHLVQAKELGLIDSSLPLNQALDQTDLVVIAIPVSAAPEVLRLVLDQVNPATTIIDMGSTKGQICKSVAQHPNRRQFVASHPIAGTENSGPSAAVQKLFEGKTNIICERDKSSEEALKVALNFFEKLGLKTIYMTPEEHDMHVAYVSHLSHVSSFLLSQTVLDIEKSEKNIFNLAGSGFASTVRLAKSSPEMWAPIFQQNREYLSQALAEYIAHLQKFQYHLLKQDNDELLKMMTKANEIRRVLRDPVKP